MLVLSFPKPVHRQTLATKLLFRLKNVLWMDLKICKVFQNQNKETTAEYICLLFVFLLFFNFFNFFIFFYHSYNLCSNLSYDQIVETVAGNAWCRWLPISANPSPSTNRTCFSETMILNHPLNKMAQQQQFRKKRAVSAYQSFNCFLTALQQRPTKYRR